MSEITYIVGDVFDQLATLDDGSVDLVVTSPPFLALRSYLPADHPDKSREIGSEATPAEFIDVLLRVTAELRRVLAPHGSIAIELGDTYAGSGGAGGDYNEDGLRDGQPKFSGSNVRKAWIVDHDSGRRTPGPGWPLAKSKTLIPELYRIALAYGVNPLTGQPSPAGQWRVRNVVTWCRPNPPVGALGDKWRPATSDVVVACVSPKRYWDDLATRKALRVPDAKDVPRAGTKLEYDGGNRATLGAYSAEMSSGAPLLDYWEIPPGGYKGAHYAVFPPELVVPLVKAMCPERVCVECGEPSRRIVDTEYVRSEGGTTGKRRDLKDIDGRTKGNSIQGKPTMARVDTTTGWTDCGHDNWRPGHVLDPFAGSGTTLAVAHGHGHDATGIDLDERNAELARERVGPMFFTRRPASR